MKKKKLEYRYRQLLRDRLEENGAVNAETKEKHQQNPAVIVEIRL